MGSWSFATSGGNSASFVNGPASPPFGTGSANFTVTTDGSAAAGIRNTSYNGTPLADITSLSYWEYATTWNGQQVPYLTLNIDSDNNGTSDDILFFEPAYQTPGSGNPGLPNQGSPVLNAWQDWDALVGGWWSTGGLAGLTPGTGVGSLATYLASFPNAVLRNTGGGAGAVRLVSGFASPADDFVGYVDGLTIGVDGADTTYNFELVPEPGTVLLGGIGLAALLTLAWRRRRSQ
jgi:hypothetical protein